MVDKMGPYLLRCVSGSRIDAYTLLRSTPEENFVYGIYLKHKLKKVSDC